MVSVEALIGVVIAVGLMQTGVMAGVYNRLGSLCANMKDLKRRVETLEAQHPRRRDVKGDD